MKEMFLLGAGASVDAGVPDTYDMTKRINERFRQDQKTRVESLVISLALGGLVFQAGVRGEDPTAGVNVEDLFSAIELLAGRSTSEVAPFISSWHPRVDELDKGEP